MNEIHNVITNMFEINAENPRRRFIINKWTYALMDTIIIVDYFMRTNVLKVEIVNKKMNIIKRPNEDNYSQILQLLRDYAKTSSNNCFIYIVVNNDVWYRAKYSYLPFFYLSIPKIKNFGLLIPDYYEDIDINNYNIERDPTKELFLVGLLNKKNIGIKEPHDTDCNAHNLHAWKTCKTLEYYNQTNFKKLFFHKIFVQELHPKKDIILLDSLFVPGVDYVIQNEPFNATIMENGHNKSKLLTKNNILLIYKTIMQKYINIMRDCPIKNIANIRLGSLLGSGYQGAVFADLNDETRVIKNMKLVRGNTSAFYEFMFAGIIAGIDKKTHHFLKFYDGFLYKNNIYLYLEKADWSLCSHNFSLRDWHKIYTNVRESMEFLHNANILHGDIQPKNIMYSKARDKFVIIDFGMMSWMPAEGPRIDYEMFADIPNRAKIGKILKQYSLDFLLSHVSDANMQILQEKLTNKNINVNAEIEEFAGFNYIKKYDVFKNDPENILFAKNITL